MLDTLFQRPDKLIDPLYVITPVFNPSRYRSRWKLHEDFVKRVNQAGAVLYEIEVAFGDRKFVFCDNEKVRQIALRTDSELWLKENMINVCERKLPHDWKYLAWVDGDVRFIRDDWADECRHLLQRYDVVQMWSHLSDLNGDNEVIGENRSFADCYLNGGVKDVVKYSSYYPYYSSSRKGYPGAPGLAWACTRKAWETFGGLIDIAILGASDWYMAHALIGKVNDVITRKYSKGFISYMNHWQDRALMLRKNLGVMKGTVVHHYHGSKVNRKYRTRDRVLVDCNYDPFVDLKVGRDGLYRLSDRSIELRDGIRKYFDERKEDN